jgi:hypothetical protein
MAEVSLAHSNPELFRVTGPLPSLVLWTEDMWRRYYQCIEVGGALNQGFPFSPRTVTSYGIAMEICDGNGGGGGVLRDSLEYKLIGCIQDHHQLCTMQAWQAGGGVGGILRDSRSLSGQDSDGGGRHRENMCAACRGYVVVFAPITLHGLMIRPPVRLCPVMNVGDSC